MIDLKISVPIPNAELKWLKGHDVDCEISSTVDYRDHNGIITTRTTFHIPVKEEIAALYILRWT